MLCLFMLPTILISSVTAQTGQPALTAYRSSSVRLTVSRDSVHSLRSTREKNVGKSSGSNGQARVMAGRGLSPRMAPREGVRGRQNRGQRPVIQV